MIKLIPVILLLTITGQCWAKLLGRPFLQNFPPPQYRASQQNWSIVQDRKGVMYFGNNDGLLEFDGVNWHLTKLPIVRTVTIDSHGRFFVGLENDMGYLEEDTSGIPRFRSLKPKIPDDHRDLSAVFYSLVLGDQVFFMADDKIFIYKEDTVKVLVSAAGFHYMAVIRDRLYIREREKGLLYLDGDSLRLIPQSERFGSERTYAMLPYGKNEILIATRTMGILIYSPESPVKFRQPAGFTEVNDFLSKNPVYCGTVLANGDFAIGTLTGGIIFFAADGILKARYNKSNGLQDNTIYWLFEDDNKQLWAAMDNGISQIPVNLPVRYYSEQNGLNGSPMCIEFFRGRLYVGTSQYLHVQNVSGNFEQISGTEGQNFRLLKARGKLLLACYQGLFEIDGNKAIPLQKNDGIIAISICSLRDRPDFLLAGSADDGFYLLHFENNSWKILHRIKGFEKSIYVAEEEGSGNFWISTSVELYRLRINIALDSVTSSRRYSSESGLPTDFAFPYALKSGEVVFGTEKGVYRYREETDRFEPHPDYDMLTGKILPFVQVRNGDIYLEELKENGNYEKGILKYTGGKYILYNTPFNKFTDIRCYESPFTISESPDSTIFICTSSCLMQYVPSMKFEVDSSFNTLIRKVTLNGKQVTVPGLNSGDSNATGKVREIPWKDNDIVFDYASSFYEDAQKNMYSYRLMGSDTSWSVWSSDHKKEYSNLRAGMYTFEVKSENLYHMPGKTVTWPFRILPPLYRTMWAYMVYIMLAGALIYILIYLRTRKLKARSLELEKIVEQRTSQIQEQKSNVEQLSRIGKNITASLSIQDIIQTVYENVNTMMDAAVFSIGLRKSGENSLEFPATIEKNQLLPSFSVLLSDKNRLAAWCFNHEQEVIINDYARDSRKYIGEPANAIVGEIPESILYLPLWNKGKAIGVITSQSFRKNAYTSYHVNILRNLATYSAIALENADAYQRLTILLDELKNTQDQLITQSKLAALGKLTAGIAHEIKNPLNFINNFSALNVELVGELEEGVIKERDRLSREVVTEIEEVIFNLRQNAEKIREHGKRADSIVRNMLQHSRGASGERQLTDINAILEEALKLTWHTMSSQYPGFEIHIEKSFDPDIERINIIPQEISRAFVNIINNGMYEAHRKKSVNGNGFLPVLSVRTLMSESRVKIIIRDNGNGIPGEVRDKIFTPFFTTKPAGVGTGLGLSIVYDIIVHQHNGQITFETEEGSFTEFTIFLPVR